MSQLLLLIKKFSALLLLVLSTIPVFAQLDESDSREVADLSEFLTKADDLLQVSVIFPLAGLSIITASFLFNSSKDGENKQHLVSAKKDFIKAFYGLIICGIMVFVFDFLEIYHEPFFYTCLFWMF